MQLHHHIQWICLAAMILSIPACARSDQRGGLDRLPRDDQGSSFDRPRSGGGGNNEAPYSPGQPGSQPGGQDPSVYQPRNPGSPDQPTTQPGIPPAGKDVTFRIPAGTGNGPWNTDETTIELNVGDTLIIINDDEENHRLHTDGTPCPHGPDMAPGESYRCEIATEYDPIAAGPHYDHHHGPTAPFWMRAITPAPEPPANEPPPSNTIAFSEVAPIIDQACGGGGCHGAGASLPIFVDQPEETTAYAASIIARVNDNQRPMPPITSGRTLTTEDRQRLIEFLR